MRITWKHAALLGLLAALAGVGGYALLISPDNPLTRLFRRKITDTDARIVMGPYPVERDFQLLEANQVRLVVSLLDPALPYEGTLLEKEKQLAAQHGMRVLNFPMSSILGRKFGGYYEGNAARAADTIAASKEKLYLHCYLGLHRIQAVRDLLTARGVQAGVYTVRHAERDRPRRLLDAAESAYNQRRYEEALATLDQLAGDEFTPAARVLQAWCLYQLGQVDRAARLFASLQAAVPVDATVGSGYCALRTNDLEGAGRFFARALQQAPANPEALGGLGLVQYRTGHPQEAARNLEAALRLAPENAELRSVLERIRAQPGG